VKETNREAIFTITSKFSGIEGFEVDFRHMKIKGKTRVELKGEGTGMVYVDLTEIQLVLDKGEALTKAVSGYVSIDDTESGMMEGPNITRVSKPLFKRFLLDMGTGFADGVAGSYGDTVTNTDGDKITRVDAGDQGKTALAGSVANAAQNVSDTYSAMWGDIVPMIAIDKGTRVNLHITEMIQFPELQLEHNEVSDLSQLY
jgi:hypothetical protein